MKKEYCKVMLDFSSGSAYEYRKDSEIPTKIEYGRIHSSKFQKGIIKGSFSNVKLHDIIFLIKRGCELSAIETQVSTDYEAHRKRDGLRPGHYASERKI